MGDSLSGIIRPYCWSFCDCERYLSSDTQLAILLKIDIWTCTANAPLCYHRIIICPAHMQPFFGVNGLWVIVIGSSVIQRFRLPLTNLQSHPLTCCVGLAIKCRFLNFFPVFSGSYKAKTDNSDRPPSRLFTNNLSCKPFSNFIRQTRLDRIQHAWVSFIVRQGGWGWASSYSSSSYHWAH